MAAAVGFGCHWRLMRLPDMVTHPFRRRKGSGGLTGTFKR